MQNNILTNVKLFDFCATDEDLFGAICCDI